MKKLVVFVPIEHAKEVKNALFRAGAGTYKNYSHCCFETHGMGQYKPLEHAQPFCCEKNSIHYVQEVKIEMLCETHRISEALQNMKKAHPYEAPAYEISALEYWGE